ncbi:MAG: GNAT family N-acetyltransferase [Desulfatitalea sp.]
MKKTVLETGVVEEKGTGGSLRPHTYVMTHLDKTHLPRIMALQRTIVGNLSRPDLLASFSREFMEQHLGPQGFILGVFVGQRLIAFRNVYFPDRMDPVWNLGMDLGLSEAERARVANLQMVCVHPAFRGNGLAMKMNRAAIDLLRQRATHEHVCATVSPYNYWNVRILLNSGFCIEALKMKYGQKLRYIVHQNLSVPSRYGDEGAVRVSMGDLEGQREQLKAGFHGVDLVAADSPEGVWPVHGAGPMMLLFKSKRPAALPWTSCPDLGSQEWRLPDGWCSHVPLDPEAYRPIHP